MAILKYAYNKTVLLVQCAMINWDNIVVHKQIANDS